MDIGIWSLGFKEHMIIIDFDDTLCNTGQLWQAVAKMLEKKYGLSPWLFFELRHKVLPKITTLYRLDEHLKEIAASTDIKKSQLPQLKKDILTSIEENTHKFLFSDTIRFLKKYTPNLILLTLGEKEPQGAKIEGAGIEKYFKEIIITRRIKAKDFQEILIPKYSKETLIFIDDKPNEVNSVEKKCPQVFTVRMKRPEGRFTAIDSSIVNLSAEDLDKASKVIDKVLKSGKM